MPRQTEDVGTHAARRGAGVEAFVNSVEVSSMTVLTTDTLVTDIPEGYHLMITCISYNVEDQGCGCGFELVCTNQVGGQGTITPLASRGRIDTGTPVTGRQPHDRPCDPPIRCAYSDGARSVTMRVIPTDGIVTISCGYRGWMEKEV